MLKLDQITKKFHIGTPDETTLFNQFCFEVQKGEFVSIVGSNGSGKTTLLNIVCGSLPVEGGKVFFGGKDITRLSEYKRADQIGRVFQDPKKGTCDELTILENMALADNKHKAYGLSRGVNKRRTDYYRTLLETCGMGLEDRLNVKAGTLSGGQRQALALILANMTDIELLILDEHTAALDPKSSETVMRITDQIVKEKQVTSLMVTHNLRFALEYGSRLVMMHEGRCVLDVRGEEKQRLEIDALLKVFNEISVECGN
jgi:putative ABC transport system ATP-binding protein